MDSWHIPQVSPPKTDQGAQLAEQCVHSLAMGCHGFCTFHSATFTKSLSIMEKSLSIMERQENTDAKEHKKSRNIQEKNGKDFNMFPLDAPLDAHLDAHLKRKQKKETNDARLTFGSRPSRQRVHNHLPIAQGNFNLGDLGRLSLCRKSKNIQFKGSQVKVN